MYENTKGGQNCSERGLKVKKGSCGLRWVAILKVEQVLMEVFFFFTLHRRMMRTSVEDVVLVEGWYFVKGSVTWMRTSIDEDLVLV